jgi:hypothetical protein
MSICEVHNRADHTIDVQEESQDLVTAISLSSYTAIVFILFLLLWIVNHRDDTSHRASFSLLRSQTSTSSKSMSQLSMSVHLLTTFFTGDVGV